MPFPIPNAKSTFLDQNGVPLAAGQVFTYIPGTSSPSPTYTDETLSVANPNPIVLDQAGTCVMWGDGYFRQVVQDMFGNLIWDYTTGIEIDQVDGNLSVSGNINADGTLSVSGAANFGNALSIAGNLNAGGALDVAGQAAIGGFLNVTGGMNLNSGNLNVANGEIYLSTNNTFLFGVDTSGNQYILIGMDPSDIIHIGTNNPGQIYLEAIGGVYITGQQLTVDGNGQVNGTFNSNGMMSTQGNLDAAGTLNVYQSAYIYNGLNVNGPFAGSSGEVLVVTGGDLVPGSLNQGNVGSSTVPWANMYANNYVTQSTDPSSSPLPNGALQTVTQTPVKTLPHIGIASSDAMGAAKEATSGNGMSYNVLLGILWKAVQELSAKVDGLAPVGMAPAGAA